MTNDEVQQDTPSSPEPKPKLQWLFTGMYRTGVLLVWLSVLILGFAGWQLWGTGLHTAQAQDELANEFDDIAASLSTVPSSSTITVPTTLPETTTTTAPDTIPPAETIHVSSTTTPAEPAGPASSDAPQTSVVTVTESTVVPERPTSASNWFKVATGDPVARIQIPSIGVDAYVIAGVTKEALRDGPGHYPGSVLPGQNGNSVIAGHRTTYGAVFGDADLLQPGDQVIVTIPTGDRYTYTVTTSEVVSPDDVGRVMGWTPGAELTLLTCTPKYSAQSRLIVHATLDAGRSSGLWEAPPNPVIQYTDHSYTTTIEVDEPELVPVEVVDEVTGDTITVEVPAESADEVRVVDGEVIIPDTDTDTDTGDGEGDGSAVADGDSMTSGFDEGWFSDTSAIFPSIVWLAAFIAVVGFARLVVYKRLNRRYGHSAVRTCLLAAGVALVGVPAALVCLWFLYTNIARLLPGSV